MKLVTFPPHKQWWRTRNTIF